MQVLRINKRLVITGDFIWRFTFYSNFWSQKNYLDQYSELQTKKLFIKTINFWACLMMFTWGRSPCHGTIDFVGIITELRKRFQLPIISYYSQQVTHFHQNFAASSPLRLSVNTVLSYSKWFFIHYCLVILC